jgi:predicted Zn-dependent protease
VLPANTNWRLANKYKNLTGSPWASYGNNHGFNFAIASPPGSWDICIEANNNTTCNLPGRNVDVQFRTVAMQGVYAATGTNCPYPPKFGLPNNSCEMTSATITFDTTDTLGDGRWEDIATHELGHAIGLAHPPTPGVTTVMHQFIGGSGALVSTTAADGDGPQSYDRASLQSLYP